MLTRVAMPHWRRPVAAQVSPPAVCACVHTRWVALNSAYVAQSSAVYLVRLVYAWCNGSLQRVRVVCVGGVGFCGYINLDLDFGVGVFVCLYVCGRHGWCFRCKRCVCVFVAVDYFRWMRPSRARLSFRRILVAHNSFITQFYTSHTRFVTVRLREH